MSSLTAAPTARNSWRIEFIAVALFVALALVPFAAAFGAESFLLNLVVRVMVFAIAALAVDFLCGFGGLVTFGHAAFVGLGAYAVAIAGAHGVTDMTITLPLAILTSALFAYVTGTICLRTSGVYFIMITLAFGQMAYFIAGSLSPYGGDDGITLPARSTLFGFPVFESDRVLYYAVLGFLAGSYLLLRAIVYSRFGRVFRGARENPTRMATIGYDVFRYQRIGYVIAGSLGGLAGFLLANTTEFVSPAYMSWQRSGELIIMVIFGGIGTLHGAIVGAAAYLLLEEWLAGYTENWKLIFGPMLVLIVLFARGGIVGLFTSIKARLTRG